MPKEFFKELPEDVDLSMSYLDRRSKAHEGDWESWYRKMARPKFQEDPNIRKIFAKKASDLIAQGYDKDDIEREWGMNAGILPEIYEPADFIADLATFGLSTPGRQAVKMGVKALKAGEREVAKETGKFFAKETAREVGYGAMAGASMMIAEELGAGPIVEMMSGFIGPTATMGICTLGRKGLTTWMRRLRTNNPDLHARILKEADNLPDNEFARLVKEIEAPGGAPFKPTKEPWEMTKAEWEKAVEEIKVQGHYIEKPTKGMGVREAARISEYERLKYGVSGQEIIEKEIYAAPVTHKRIIEKALSEGKSIPPHVAAEYPDLKVKLKEPEPPKPPREFEGPSTVDDALGIMQSEVETAKVIGKKEVRGKVVSETEYPEWFTGKGWTKKQVMSAFKKKQGPIYDDLRHIAEGRLEMYGRVMGKDIAAGDLKEGDVLTLSSGEEFKVAEMEEGNIRLENDETIQTDEFGLIRDVVKLEEHGKLAPPERLEELARGAGIQKSIIEAMGDPRKELIELTKKKQPLIVTWEAAKIIDPSERAININLSKFNTVDDIKEATAKIAKLFPGEIHEARRGKVSWKETEKLADMMGLTPEQFVKRQRGEALNATELKAAQILLINTAAVVSDFAKKAAMPMATEVDKFAFRRAFNTLYAVEAHYSGAVAEAGRALNILKTEGMGSAQRAREIKDMLFTMEGAMPIEKQAALIATLDSPRAISVTARQAMKATTWDMFFEAWINGLLSGLTTHTVNTTSTGLFSLWQIPERYLAAGISRVMPGPQEIKTGEANALLWGMIEGFKDGVRTARKTFVTAQPLEEYGKLEMRRIPAITAANMNLDPAGPFGRAVDILGEIVRSPTTRGLMAEDDLFKATLYRAELKAQAYRQASMEGLEGRDFAKAMQETVNNPPENIKLAGKNFARYGTFQEPLGEMGKSVQQALNKCPPARLIVPFFRTGTNLAKTFHERTLTYPLTSALPILWGKQSRFLAEIAAGGARRDLALAKISAGSMFMGVAATWAAQGYITGGGPEDKSARDALKRMKWQSYSFCTNPGEPIEDRTYVKFNRIDPFGFFLGTVADMTEIMGNVDQMTSEEIAATGVVAFAENVTSKTWIRGFSDFNEAYSDPKRYMDDYLRRMAGTLIPTGVAQVEKVIDPEFREVNTWLDQIKSRTPGWSKTLRPGLNRWAEPRVGGTIRGEEGSWLWLPVDLMNPFYISKGKKSPIDKEIYEQGFNIPAPSRIMQGVKLHDDEYHRYRILEAKEVRHPISNKNLKDTLDFIIEHPAKAQALGLTTLRYDKMSDGPDGYKGKKLQQIAEWFKEEAQRQLKEEFPELDRIIEDMRMEKAKDAEAMMGGMQ